MIINIGVSISFLLVLIIIIICFLSKMRISKYENTIFILLTFLTTIGLSIETFIYQITMYYKELYFLLKPLVILLFIYYVIWMYLFVSYNLFLLNENAKRKKNKILLISIYTLFLFASIILPFKLEITDLYFYPQGIGTYAQYIFASIGFTIIMINSLKNIKVLKNKKFIPLIVCILLGIITSALQYFRHEFMFVVPSHAIAVILMYFTIENPDIKMVKELTYQKKLVEHSSKKTLELLEDMSDDLKSSIQKLELFGHKKIDKNDIEKLNKELTKFQNDSIKLSDKITGILDLTMIKSNTSYNESKYEVLDMIDKLKQLTKAENKKKVNFKTSKDLPPVVYGDENNIIKVVLYFYNLISSIVSDEELNLFIESTKVGRFSRIKFKFVTADAKIRNYIIENKETKTLEFVKEKDLNYEIIKNLIKKFNGKLQVTESGPSTSVSLCLNQRLLTEYQIISNKEENKNIKIKYHDYSDKRILIVDNNNYKIKEIKVLLNPYNIEVFSVNNPNQMRQILNKDITFDLILLDDIIPNFKLDDFTNEIIKSKENNLLNLIKKDAKYPIPTVIMITPNSDKMEEKYLNYGFNDYIIKPINKNNLNKLLNKYFNKTKKQSF